MKNIQVIKVKKSWSAGNSEKYLVLVDHDDDDDLYDAAGYWCEKDCGGQCNGYCWDYEIVTDEKIILSEIDKKISEIDNDIKHLKYLKNTLKKYE